MTKDAQYLEALLDAEPHPHSVELMDIVDELPLAMRLLVYEYGLAIVVAMINDGYTDPHTLADLLTTWRYRRQEEWLKTDFIRPRRRRP